jgi:hypothetical protein
MAICHKKFCLGSDRGALAQRQRLDMWDKQLALRPPFRQLSIRNLPECGARELYSEFE